MTIRSQIEAMLHAAAPREADEPHPKGPKYLYFNAGTVTTVNSGKNAGQAATHQVRHRSLNPARQGKRWK